MKKKQQYKVTLNYNVEPLGSVYIKITFYRKNDTEHSNLIIQNSDAEFEFPEEAYAYKIELINAGLSELFFKNIIIQELDTDESETQSIVESKVNLDVLNRVIFGESVNARGDQNG